MTIPERVDGLMKSRHIKNRAELSRLSGIPYTTIDGVYKNPQENITLKTLRRLSDFFGVSLDYLITGLEGEKEIFLTPEDTAMLALYKDMNQTGQRKLREYAEDLYDRYKNV